MLDSLATALLDLRRESRKAAGTDFQAWALERFQMVLEYDAAFWGTGAYVDDDPILHTSIRYRLPAENEQMWDRYRQIDECVPHIMAAQGRMVAINHDRLSRMAVYEHVWQPFGVAHLMSAYQFDASNGLYEIFSFYRSDTARPFTADECRLGDSLIAHLGDTYRIHQLGQLCVTARDADPYQRALADRKGVLHSAEQPFAEVLAAEWPAWRGPLLPEPLVVRLEAEPAFRFAGKRVIIEVRPARDPALVSLFARPVNPVDLLTARELEVARLFTRGLSHKEVARDLAISPATVRVHLSSIYQKTEIDNKAALTGLLARMDYA